MNPQQRQFIYNAPSHVFSLDGVNPCNLNITTHGDVCAGGFFTLHPAQSSNLNNLALQVCVAPDWTVGVRIAIAGETHAFNELGAPPLVTEELLGRLYVRFEEVGAGHCMHRVGETWAAFGDPMDMSEDEMYWNDSMEVGY
ncbi:hypothetical protein AUP68_06649 [Ilyonectria robusta]